MRRLHASASAGGGGGRAGTQQGAGAAAAVSPRATLSHNLTTTTTATTTNASAITAQLTCRRFCRAALAAPRAEPGALLLRRRLERHGRQLLPVVLEPLLAHLSGHKVCWSAASRGGGGAVQHGAGDMSTRGVVWQQRCSAQPAGCGPGAGAGPCLVRQQGLLGARRRRQTHGSEPATTTHSKPLPMHWCSPVEHPSDPALPRAFKLPIYI